MRLFFSIIILSSPLKIDVTIHALFHEGHYVDINPELAGAQSSKNFLS